jgi:hypothetical protein
MSLDGRRLLARRRRGIVTVTGAGDHVSAMLGTLAIFGKIIVFAAQGAY